MSDRRSPRPAAYHGLSVQQKQAAWLQRARVQPTRCSACATGLMACDLPGHAQRCAGSRELRDARLVKEAWFARRKGQGPWFARRP